MPFISKINGVDFSASYAATSSYVNLGTNANIGPQFLSLDDNNYPVLRGYRLYISGGTSTTITGDSVYVGVNGGNTQLYGTVSLPVATYNITASQAQTASFAVSSSFTTTSSFAISSSRAISSSFATRAITASFLQNDDPLGLTLSVAKGITLQATDPSTGIITLNSKNIQLTGSTGTTITAYGNILPGGPYTNNTSSFNLGSPTAAWKDLYVSNGSINFISGSTSASIQFNNGQITFPGSSTNISGSLTGSLLGTASWATNAAFVTDATNASYIFISENQPNAYPWTIPVLEGGGGGNSLLSATGPSKGSSTSNWFFDGGIEAGGFFPNAGSNIKPPLKLTAGTNLTTPEAGAIEYDGTTFYYTNDTTSGRGYEPSIQIFRLTASLAAIGPTIANFFGPTSSIQLAGGGIYEIEAYCYFSKTTNGTVTVTISSSLAPINLNGIIQHGAAGGNGAAQQIATQGQSATAIAFGASTSLTTATGHAFTIKLLVESNASNSNLRFLFTESAGTVTPLRGSYYKVTRLPSGRIGNFVA
jgi:hypothetical protein